MGQRLKFEASGELLIKNLLQVCSKALFDPAVFNFSTNVPLSRLTWSWNELEYSEFCTL